MADSGAASGSGDAVPARTQVERACRAIVEAAAKGRYLPGDRLVEGHIAKELGISRVPVREALRVLESRGIVTSVPYKGMRLLPLSRRDVAEMIALREALELFVLREAIGGDRPPQAWDRVAHSIALGQRAVEIDDGALMRRADHAFHRALWHLAGNALVTEQLEILLERQSLIWRCVDLHGRMSDAHAEHVAMLRHARAGETEAAMATMSKHLHWLLTVDVEAAMRQRRGG
ncbi:GntR family transcriptional regulator [Roseomonas sp. NAR14]|uniref:GntR family transcriptional regulator n=1 Tax=Roseomonas acroporae TaxID=2937791 RepID=A0A9X2BWJ2_9PROT|nr:GntR family transcriptional regulator [Roseomonas acroporae]MCK8785009.1 GntR family transcriptional regulator [Roseomonas acroporae]